MSVLEKIYNVLKAWRYRNLSLYGKITVFKTLAISSIVYVSYMSVVPKNVIDLLDNLQNEFIWSGKKAKIKHSTLIGDFKQGGLKKVDIVTKIQSLQLSWIKRLPKCFHLKWNWQCLYSNLTWLYLTACLDLFCCLAVI